jgi:hypothetical protein
MAELRRMVSSTNDGSWREHAHNTPKAATFELHRARSLRWDQRRGNIWLPCVTSRTFGFTRSQLRNLLSIARLNMARSRT